MSTPKPDPSLEDEPSDPSTSEQETTTTSTVTTRSGSKKGKQEKHTSTKQKAKLEVQSQIEQLQKMVHDMAEQQAKYIARIAELEAKQQVKKEEKDHVRKDDDGIGLGLFDDHDAHGGNDDGDESDEDGGNDDEVSTSYHLHDDKDHHVGMVKMNKKLVPGGHDDQNEPIVLPRIPKSLVPFKGESGDSVRNWLDQYDTIRVPLKWTDRQSVAVCAMHLHGRASQWYQEEGKKNSVSSSWKTFRAALLKRFTPVVNQLFIPKYTKNLVQREHEKSVDFMDRVRKELRDLGVDNEEWVVRVFSSGLHSWIVEPLTMVVGDESKLSAKNLLDYCNKIELSKAIHRGTHFNEVHRGNDSPKTPFGYKKNGEKIFVPGYPKLGVVKYTSNEKIQLTPKDTCKICGKTGHWARECPNRAGGKPANQAGGTKICSYCNKAGHLVDQCYTRKNDLARKEAAHPRTMVAQGKTPIRNIQFSEAEKELGAAAIRMIKMVGQIAAREYGVFSIKGSVGGVKMWCTLDTGADQVSCLEETCYNLLPVEMKGKLQVSTQQLVSAVGHELSLLGVVVLPLRILGVDGVVKEMDVKFYVVRGLNVPCLLGTNFFLNCGVGLDWSRPGRSIFKLWNGDDVEVQVRQREIPDGKVNESPSSNIKLHITRPQDQQVIEEHYARRGMNVRVPKAGIAICKQGPPVEADVVKTSRGTEIMVPKERKYGYIHDQLPNSKREVLSIRLIRSVTLPPNSAMVVPFSYAYCPSEMQAGSALMAYGNEKLYQDGVMVAHSVHEVSKEKKDTKLVLQVTNTTRHPITYRRGQLVGTAEQVDIMSLKEKEEIEKSKDVYQEILHEIEEKIHAESDDSGLTTPTSHGMVMDVLSQFTHLFDDRHMGEARQQGQVVEHTINTGLAPPRRAHPYRQSPAMEAIIEQEIDKQLQAGVIKHSNSPWASPIVMVKKKDGKWRMCIDYRGLNALTVPDVYPLPAIDQLLYNMRDAKVFTTMDLQSAYNQIAVAPPDRPKTAFIHRTGLYEYTRMPFGLRNAPSTFQRFMNMIMGTGDATMQIYVMVYLDDVVIFSATVEDHCIHLHNVLAIISRHGLKLKLSKCEFARNRIHYLGHVLDANGVHVDPAKVRAVSDMPLPTKVVELQSFLGMCGYYRRFIDKYSTIAQPLHELLRQDMVWKWEEQHTNACNQLKQALVSAPVLVMPDYSKLFIVQTDASGVGIGAVLCQMHEVNRKMVEKPIAYVSRGLKKHERNYSVTHLELLAVVWSLKQFRHYVLGKRFLLQTDHIALESIRKTKDLSGRMARWILVLQEYEFDVQYRKGHENANADALSRLPLTDANSSPYGVNMVSISDVTFIRLIRSGTARQAESALNENELWKEQHYELVQQREQKEEMEQKHDNMVSVPSQVANIDQFVLISSVLYHIHMMNNRTHLDHMVLQICLPKAMVPRILREMHDAPFSGHLSTVKTYGRILHRYFWFGMYEDIKNYCESCDVCARRKMPHRQQNIPMLSPQLDRLTQYGPMECIAMDIIGPITMSNGKTTFMYTVVDLYTRWGGAYAIRSQDTRHISQAWVSKWVCEHGFPRTILSDNGPGFVSKVWKKAMTLMGVKVQYSLPYHPESNGACERLNATIKNMLSSYTRDAQSGWANFLPFVVFAYNTSVHAATGFTPYRLLYGREAVIGSEAVLTQNGIEISQHYPAYLERMHKDMASAHQLIEQRVHQAADERNAINEQYRVIATYQIGDQVYVYWPPKSSKKNKISAKLTSPYRGPFTVTRQFNAVSYRVKENSTGKHVSVHVSRMKKVVERDAELVAEDVDEAPFGVVADDAERDHMVHEFTRAQRQQRIRQQQMDAERQRQDDAAAEEDELEEGEVPPNMVQRGANRF